MLVWKKLMARCLGLLLLLTVGGALTVAPLRADLPGKDATTFRFVVYGDTRDGHTAHRKLVALILAQKPAFIVGTGDYVRAGSDESLWKIYDEITGAMRKEIPLYTARGNHDMGGPGYEERVLTAHTTGGKLYYSFDAGSLHFVSIDNFSPLSPGSAEYDWLVKDLDAAQQKGLYIIPYFHVPPFSVGAHGSSPVTEHLLCPLFLKHGIRLVFNGHDHIYYHTKRDGITYVVSGGGGAPLYPVHKDQEVAGDVGESVHHIVVCDVDASKITFTALREDGTQIEKFSLPLSRPSR